MQYIKVAWKHMHPDDPTLLYSELDDDRWEVRKVEIFQQGAAGYASRAESKGSTRLSTEPIPSLSKIALDPEFEPAQITKEEFEEVWLRALRG